MNPRKSLRQQLAKPGYAIVPGAHDTLTARLVQLAGFDAVYLTAGGYSRANGYPDIGLLTLTARKQ
jgi:2-methylisocitrate lyase-like PEP mutase family enzyme